MYDGIRIDINKSTRKSFLSLPGPEFVKGIPEFDDDEVWWMENVVKSSAVSCVLTSGYFFS